MVFIVAYLRALALEGLVLLGQQNGNEISHGAEFLWTLYCYVDNSRKLRTHSFKQASLQIAVVEC